MRAADDDAPFSDSMLEWLEEGDKIGDGSHPAASRGRPSGGYAPLESGNRRIKFIVGGALAVGGGLVLVLRLMGGHAAPEDGAKTASAVAAPAPQPVAAAPAPVAPAPVAAAPAPVAAAPVAPAAPVAAAPAPVAAAPVAPISAPPSLAAALTASAPKPVARAVAAVPVEKPTAAPVEPVAPKAAAAKPAPAPLAGPAPLAKVPATPPVAAPLTKVPADAPAVAPAAPAASAGAYASALTQCRAYMNAGKIRHAVDSCRLATEADPRAPEALTLLAEAEFTRGHTGIALRLATDATSASPNYADAYVIIGGVYQDKGKTAEARAAYEQYLALQPKGKHAADLRAILDKGL